VLLSAECGYVVGFGTGLKPRITLPSESPLDLGERATVRHVAEAGA
jgi:hypothetical protein